MESGHPDTEWMEPLERILSAAGYEVQARPEGLVALRGRDRRGVVMVRGLQSPVEIAPLFPADIVHRSAVYRDDPGPVARSLAADRGIEVIDRSTLGASLGEILLWPGVQRSDPGTESVPTPLEPPMAVFPAGEPIVRPRLGRREIEIMHGIEGASYRLRLVPFYLGAYRVRSPAAHGEPGPTSDHLVAVHAISQRAEIWEIGDRDWTPELSDPHDRLDAVLPVEAAEARAREAIRRHHTIAIDHTEQHGGAMVIEKRRIPPAPDDIRLGPMATIFVPYWYVESPRGRHVIDATTGRAVLPEGDGPG
ncbi:MAG: hypothetical protein ACYCPV_01415 [Thermoplasmata archaeon]